MLAAGGRILCVSKCERHEDAVEGTGRLPAHRGWRRVPERNGVRPARRRIPPLQLRELAREHHGSHRSHQEGVEQVVLKVLTATGFVAIAALGIARAQDVASDKGEQIQNAACLGCHDLRPIQTAAYDRGMWASVVDSMINKGAEVKDADKPVLIDYLAKSHGPL